MENYNFIQMNGYSERMYTMISVVVYEKRTCGLSLAFWLWLLLSFILYCYSLALSLSLNFNFILGITRNVYETKLNQRKLNFPICNEL